MKANNKVIVVSGAGSGMGREITLNLLAKGAKVAAVDLNETTLNETAELAKAHKDNLAVFVLSVADKAAVEALPAQVVARFGAVDGVINNAGIIQPFVRLADLDYSVIERVLDVNLYGVIYMVKAFLPLLKERPEAHIVNVSSMGGFLPVPGQTIYGASKAAVKLLTEGLYAELINTNVNVTLIYPGAIATNITTNSGVAAPNVSADVENQSAMSMPADKAAEVIVNAMENNRYSALVGSDAKFLDFIYRLNPKGAVKFISDKMKDLLPA
ncbi:MAG: SDR family NAD(P)-dependent oxidoreductase [Anaerolineales bacterium]|nr:SDR family NAD(P)-dependent oxidoreductase [Anaerolineales bacterium]